MQEVEKVQEEVISDMLHDTAYMGSGLGRTILGPVENINSINRDDLTSFIKSNYTGPRMVVAGAGAVDHAQLTELSEKHFSGLSNETGVAPVADKANFIGSDFRRREDSMPLAHVAIAFESAGWDSEHAFPLMVMQTMLGCWGRTNGSGSNMASKLCQDIANNEAAHSVMSFNSCYKDTGLFGVYGVAEPTTLNDFCFYTLKNMVRLCHKTTDEEVARARTQLKATMLAHLDSSSQVCEDIGRQMLTYSRRITPAELFARIDMVDAPTVRETATKFISDNDIAVAALGPLHELPDYNWLRRRTYWLSM